MTDFSKVVALIYEEDKSRVPIHYKIEEYIRKPGVWVMKGINCETELEECLNVGSSEDIGMEILYDLACLHFLDLRLDGDKNYINQFKKDCKFKYKSGQTQEYLYPYISKNYHSISFELVHSINDKKFERYYAHEHEPLFWRNGAPYKNGN